MTIDTSTSEIPQDPDVPVDPVAGEVDPVAPALVADQITVTGPRGPLVHRWDLSVEPGVAVALVGAGGSGRSALLLALAGRLPLTAGRIALAGHSRPRDIRHRSAVARIADLVVLEPRHTVAEALSERCLSEGEPSRSGRERFAEACRTLGFEVASSDLIEHLPPLAATRLAVALACVRSAELIVLDDADLGLSPAEQEQLWTGLVALAAVGPLIVATTADPAPAAAAGAVIEQLGEDA